MASSAFNKLPPEVQGPVAVVGLTFLLIACIGSYFYFKDWNGTYLYEGDAIEITSPCTTTPTKIFVRYIIVDKRGTLVADLNGVSGEFPSGHMFSVEQEGKPSCIIAQVTDIQKEYRQAGNVDRVTIRWPEHLGNTAIRYVGNEIPQPVPTRIRQFFSSLWKSGAAVTP